MKLWGALWVVAAAACGGARAAGPAGGTTSPTPVTATPPTTSKQPAVPRVAPPAGPVAAEALALVSAAHEGRALLSADRLLSGFTASENLLSIGVEPGTPLIGRKQFEAAVRAGFSSGLKSARRVATSNQVWAAPDGSFATVVSDLVEEGAAEYHYPDGKVETKPYHLPLRLSALARREDGKLRLVLWRLTAQLPLDKLAPAIAAEVAGSSYTPGLADQFAATSTDPVVKAVRTVLALEGGAIAAPELEAQLADGEVTLLSASPGEHLGRAAWLEARAAAAARGRTGHLRAAGGFADAHGAWIWADLIVEEPTRPELLLRVTAVLTPDATGQLRVRLLDEGVPVPAAAAVELVNP